MRKKSFEEIFMPLFINNYNRDMDDSDLSSLIDELYYSVDYFEKEVMFIEKTIQENRINKNKKQEEVNG